MANKKDDILFINYKDTAETDQLFVSGREAQSVSDDGSFVLKISTNNITPKYLITFSFEDDENHYALRLNAEMRVEESGKEVTDLLDNDVSTVSSDELTALINQGLYGELILDELETDATILQNTEIKIILIGNMLIRSSRPLAAYKRGVVPIDVTY